MEVILLEDIPALGYKNDVVTVKAGYARNFLIPRKRALVANPSNTKMADEMKSQQAARLEKDMAHIRDSISSITDGSLQIGAKSGTSGKIFGRVTTIQVAEAINKATGLNIDRRNIQLSEEIKALGTYVATVQFHRDMKEEVPFEVVSE